MLRMRCVHCGFQTTLSVREAEFGMVCPECHAGTLTRKPKGRPGKRFTKVRPSTVSAMVGVVACVVSGPPLLLATLLNVRGKSGFLWGADLFFGVLLTAGIVICLVLAIVGLYRDLR